VFAAEFEDKSVVMRFPGDEVTKEVAPAGLIGDPGIWQQSPAPTPADVVFGFRAGCVAEARQELMPLSDAPSESPTVVVAAGCPRRG